MKRQKGEMGSILLIAVVVLTLASFISYRTGVGNERTAQERTALKKQQEYNDAEIAARTLHAQVTKKIVDAQNKTNLENAYDHEIALEKVNADLFAARAESKRLGGLRITVPACPASGNVGVSTQTAGIVQHHEEGTTTVALPEPVEAGLWSIVGQADEVSEQLRSCQGWIKANGFYGEK